MNKILKQENQNNCLYWLDVMHVLHRIVNQIEVNLMKFLLPITFKKNIFTFDAARVTLIFAPI